MQKSYRFSTIGLLTWSNKLLVILKVCYILFMYFALGYVHQKHNVREMLEQMYFIAVKLFFTWPVSYTQIQLVIRLAFTCN